MAMPLSKGKQAVTLPPVPAVTPWAVLTVRKSETFPSVLRRCQFFVTLGIHSMNLHTLPVRFEVRDGERSLIRLCYLSMLLFPNR